MCLLILLNLGKLARFSIYLVINPKEMMKCGEFILPLQTN